MATHYETLGVDHEATHHDIKRAYHGQARRHHPDTRPGADAAAVEQARRRMAAINAAWTVLGDPVRRRSYDMEIGVPTRPRGPTGPDVWVPLDPEDDLDFGEDEVEEAGPRGPADLVVMVPVGLFLLAMATFAFSVLSQSPSLMWVAIVLLPVAGVAFVATPLVVMFTRARARAKP